MLNISVKFVNGTLSICSIDSTSMPCPDSGLSNIDSRSEMEENGWMFRVSHSNMLLYDNICGSNGWFGFYTGPHVGSVSAVFKGTGTAKLVYGNCWNDKEVAVYLNYEKMSSAHGNQTKIEIVLNFFTGDRLQIVEDGAIVKLHSLTILCDGMYLATYSLKYLTKIIFQEYINGNLIF